MTDANVITKRKVDKPNLNANTNAVNPNLIAELHKVEK